MNKCLGFIFVLLVMFVAEARSHGDEDRPNFVWLVSEDNSKHFLKLFDEHGAETPNIAKLAKQGLVFRNAFSNAPVCSVARTTLITSCFAPRIGTQFHRKSKPVPLPAGVKAFPELLRKAGYYTTNKRKTDFNAIVGDQVWDASSKKASWRDRQSRQPFFHMQSFGGSHEGSLHFPKRAMKQKTGTDPAKVFLSPKFPDTKTFRYTAARYHDRIVQVDEQIGKVVQELEKDGLLDSTFIFYFGDHGGVLPGSKGYAYEVGLHVPLVVRIPEKFKHLVPVKAGSDVNGFVSFVDFGPTLLNLAGIETPKGVDGRAFLGAGITADDLEKRDTTFGYADRFDEKYDMVRTIRVGNFKYIRNYQPFNVDGLQNNYRYKMLAYQEWRSLHEQGKLNEVQGQFFKPRPCEQLFDISNDPYETKNLSNSELHQDTLLELRKRLSHHVKRTSDLSFYPESSLHEKGFDNPTRFGKIKQKEIADLVDLADLSLKPFDEVKDEIQTSLRSEKMIVRYWALIVCTCFGDKAKALSDDITKISLSDRNNLVRSRAAEFLAIANKTNPSLTLTQAIYESKSGVEAAIIANTIVLLRDFYGFEIKLDANKIKDDVKKDFLFKRRFDYLKK